MAFTHENGTGVAGANTYLTPALYKAYADDHGISYVGVSDAAINQAGVRGTTWIEGTYSGRWAGNRVKGRSQGLSWPRRNVIDGDGEDVPDDEVPWEVLAATSEATKRELETPGSLSPDVDYSQRIKQEQVGSLSVTYQDARAPDDVVPVVTIVDNLLKPLLLDDGSSAGWSWLQRA